jgi:hypothetical protein
MVTQTRLNIVFIYVPPVLFEHKAMANTESRSQRNRNKVRLHTTKEGNPSLKGAETGRTEDKLSVLFQTKRLPRDA